MELSLKSRLNLTDTVLSLLDELPAFGRGRQPLVNLVGPPGIGKSHALRQLFERIAPTYAVAALDFAWPDTPWAVAAPALAPLLPPDCPPPTGADLADLTLRLTWSIPADRAPQSPWALLLDGIDGLPHWQALQRALIKPVAERGPALVVVASRAPVAWHFWELRDRCRTLALPRLELAETLDIARPARAPLGPPLHALAHGHPVAAETLLRHFTVAPPRNLPDAQIDALGERARKMVRVVGVMRTVHVPTMQRLLARFMPEWPALAAAEPRALDGVLRELKAAGHLRYSRHHSTIINPALRRSVEAGLARYRPELLAGICRELELIYGAEAEARPLTAASALNEWLYFSTMPPGRGDDALQRWTARMRHLFTRRVALGGDDLPAQIYRDEDLIEQLQRTGRLEAVHEALRDCAPIDAAVFTQDGDRYSAYAAELLGRLLSPASHEEGARLRGLLDAAREVDDPFSAAELAIVVAGRSGDTVHGVRRDLTLLADRGCCIYDAEQRTYALDPLIRRLIAPPA